MVAGPWPIALSPAPNASSSEVGGGPTFVGTLIGQTWVSESLSIVFLSLAAGSILYVVVELVNVPAVPAVMEMGEPKPALVTRLSCVRESP